MRLFTQAAGLTLLLSTIAPAQRIYVDSNITKPGDGTTWSKAYMDLQTALGKARAGNEIWVARGTYVGGFTVPVGVKLYGGFAAGDTRLSQRYVIQNATILDGADKQRVLMAGSAAVIEGFIITRGRASGSGLTGGGSGMLIEGTSPAVRNCIFRDNNITGGRGSALHVTVDKNNVQGKPLFENVLIYDNGKTTKFGHTVDVTTAGGTYINLTIDNNHDNGFHFHQGASPKIYNSVFSNNTGRGVCHISSNDTPLIEHCLFWNNTVSLMHYRGRELRSAKEINALSYAKNNLVADPRFPTSKQGLYAPLPGSPLIDAGRTVAGMPFADAMGNGRMVDGDLNGSEVPDIGAIEFVNGRLDITGSLTPGGQVKLALTGTAKLNSVLALATTPSAGVNQPGLGTFFFDLTKPVIYLGWAPVGTTVPITIPKGTPKGTQSVLQAFVFNNSYGNLTNGLDLRIR